MKKSLLKSKTFYMGIIMATVPLFPVVEAWIVANPVLIGGIWGALTVGMRYITKDKVVLLP